MKIDLFRDLTGQPVVDYTGAGAITDFSAVMPRILHEFEDPAPVDETFLRMMEEPGATRLSGLVVGDWLEEEDAGRPMDRLIDRLAEAAPRLSRLRYLFLAELPLPGTRPRWRGMRDLSPLWRAFPRLELFYGRGHVCRRLGPFRHCRARRLILKPNEFIALTTPERAQHGSDYRPAGGWG